MRRGYALVMALLSVALVGLASTLPLTQQRTQSLRERETELLWVGEQFRSALESYAAASPAGTPTAPLTLDDLLEDRRFPTPQRHLRRLYVDPLTGRADWAVLLRQGRIVALHSRARGRPLRQAGFHGGQRGFAGAESYAAWEFAPRAAAPPAAAPPAASAPSRPELERQAACRRAYLAQAAGCNRLDGDERQDCVLRARSELQACVDRP
jgi:type II secretory pathway pseudopilin PulG